MKRKSLVVVLATLVTAFSGSLYADKPETPPNGMGKYFLFLKVPPPVPPGQAKKTIVEPDIARLGGRVLYRADGYLVMYLPKGAVKHLRKDENVDFVQRIWVGEPLNDWEESEDSSSSSSSSSQLHANSDEDGPTWGPKTYTYDGSGNIKQLGSDTFQYDAVSRLSRAVITGTTETYEYDAFGNLTKKQIIGQPASTVTVDSGSNRLAGYTYDVAGSVTNDGTDKYAYDALGMMSATTHGLTSRRMFYTADDERIGVQVDSTLSRWKIRDFDGHVLREFRCQCYLSGGSNDMANAEWIWIEDYAYANGQLVGGDTAGPYGGLNTPIQPDRRHRHYHLDHLGTVRLITTDARISLGTHTYYPFGTEQTSFYQEESNFGGAGQIRPEPMAFTGHERDFNGWWNIDNTEYLDYMHARYYNPGWGRFLSPDPEMDIGLALKKPQTWNRYSYAANNPVVNVDPNGRAIKRYETVALIAGAAAGVLEQVAMLPGQEGTGTVASFLRTVEKTMRLGDATGEALGNNADGYDLTMAISGDVATASEAFVTLGTIAEGGRSFIGAFRGFGNGEVAQMSGMLRDAARGKGDFGIGSGSARQAEAMGKAWVGDGYKVASDGKTLISKDGLRQYRPPSYKPKLDKVQANFESRARAGGQWQSNAHLEVQ
jgi:RHS repeat-associated protein